MSTDRAGESAEHLCGELLHVERRAKRERRIQNIREIVGPWSYRAKVGKGTLRLSTIEYRILTLLASRPYHAFTRRKIAKAVSTKSHPVTPERLSHYIHSLRRQLGFYGDLIQSVPYIGYRFKA